MHVPSFSGRPCCGPVAPCGGGYLGCGFKIEEEAEDAAKALENM